LNTQTIPVPTDRDGLQGGLFVMQPTDDEFRTVRWSPATRVRPSPVDRDSVQGGLFVMTPTDDPWTQTRRWNTSTRSAPIDGGVTVTIPPLGFVPPSDEFRVIAWSPVSRVRPLPQDSDSVPGGLFVMTPVDDEWKQYRRQMTAVRLAPQDGGVTVSSLVVSPFSLDDEFRSVRWSPILRAHLPLMDLDSLQGGLFVMTPTDDLWIQRSRWNTSVRFSQIDGSGTVFAAVAVLAPPDDEYRTVRWSPTTRIRPFPVDRDSVPGGLFVMLPVDDEFRWVRWSPTVRSRLVSSGLFADYVLPFTPVTPPTSAVQQLLTKIGGKLFMPIGG
jgi:hypothetical protein